LNKVVAENNFAYDGGRLVEIQGIKMTFESAASTYQINV